MSFTLNEVTLVGRIGKKPELNKTKTDIPVTNFYIATDELLAETDANGRKMKKTEWHRIVAWKKTAEFVANHLSTGTLICVKGKLKSREWKDQTGQDRRVVEIVADKIDVVTWPPKKDEVPSAASA
jgi:single-strand DNA-binding protein